MQQYFRHRQQVLLQLFFLIQPNEKMSYYYDISEETKSLIRDFIKNNVNNYLGEVKDYFNNKTAYKKRLTVFDLTYKSIHMMQNKLAQEAILQHPVDFIVNIPFNSCYPLEFYKAKEMINLGRSLCEKTLKKQLKSYRINNSYYTTVD